MAFVGRHFILGQETNGWLCVLDFFLSECGWLNGAYLY